MTIKNKAVTVATRVTPAPAVALNDYTASQSGVAGVTKPKLVPDAVAIIIRPCWMVFDKATHAIEHPKDGNDEVTPTALPDGQLKQFGPGVWRFDVKLVAGEEKPVDIRICGPLYIVAITRNADGTNAFGRLLRFMNLDGRWCEWSMSAEMLAGRAEPILTELLNQGLQIEHRHRADVMRYIAEQVPEKRLIAATSTGWNGPSLFILPRKNIGMGNAVYQSGSTISDDFTEGGTLEGWREQIGRRCTDNPLLMAAVCVGLAGPLLSLTGCQGGGIHNYGKSSTGKTTLIYVAASLYGEPTGFIRSWRATANGLEGISAERNDTLLVLDELGESNPHDAGAIVYAVCNGVGKSRANRSGSARVTKKWRVMLLSSGEIRLASHMREAGKRTRAGQEIRLLELPVNREHGAWDNLHGLASGQAFSDALQKATRRHYGHLGPEFVRRLIVFTDKERLQQRLTELAAHFPAGNGQESRAAERFALLALAGELAISWGLIPAPTGEAIQSMIFAFNIWRAERGSLPGEDAGILESLSGFIDRHGSAMFSSLEDHDAPVRDRAGWWRDSAEGRIWLFTSEGLKRATTGFEFKQVLDVLDASGWIAERTDDQRRRKVVRIGTGTKNVYAIREPIT